MTRSSEWQNGQRYAACLRACQIQMLVGQRTED
eukprot:SAG11_NODE_18915_length_478_cov_1.102902_1_plen_32_part_10